MKLQNILEEILLKNNKMMIMIPTKEFKKIANRFPRQHRGDLIQDMTLLFLESPEERQTPQYVYTVYPLRCKDFIKKYKHNSQQVVLLDNELTDEDGETTTFADLLEDPTDMEQQIIYEDMVRNLNLTDEEKLIQRLFYYEGYTAKEIAKDFSQKTFITSVAQVYNILKKGQ